MIHAATGVEAWHSAGGAAELPVTNIKLTGTHDEWAIAKRRRHDQTADDLRDLTFAASKVE